MLINYIYIKLKYLLKSNKDMEKADMALKTVDFS